jgi:hypothetical protein
MRSKVVRGLLVMAAILCVPLATHAQDATLTGAIVDTTGGVLPGVSVIAVHEASGNTFETTTDERGVFRLLVRPGTYRVTAQLAGFATLTRGGLELLVGQQAVANLQLAPSNVQESVTVTGEAPLLEVSSSSMASNIDPRQVSEIPVNGRNWQDLAMLAPGSRANHMEDGKPTQGGGTASGNRRDFQMNLDGQQVSQNLAVGSAGSPLFSRDAIAEFQLVSSRFDATQGRSSGVQVNAITKSGTNMFSGSLSGYFRDDRFNAEDFVAGEVLPYSNQQISTTFGGPIRRDRVHFFVNYEYGREPKTFSFQTPYPAFDVDLLSTTRQDMAGGRVDLQLTSAARLMVRGDMGKERRPIADPDTAAHPSSADGVDRHNEGVYAAFYQVLSNRTLNEIRGGWNSYISRNDSIVTWPGHPHASEGFTQGTPRINLTGFAVGQACANCPQHFDQKVWSIRDDLSTSFNRGGRHDVKLGGELLLMTALSQNCRGCNSIIDAQGGSVPANFASLFPVWNDVSSWNLAALSPITRSYTVAVGTLPTRNPRKTSAAWLQDDWAVTSRLTLNLGVRYDLWTGVFANDVALAPFLEAGRPDDTNNIAPRVGFAYQLSDRTVVRGGYGHYFTDVTVNISARMRSWNQLAAVEVINDGRPNFTANPFNGPLPTFDQAVARFCSTADVPGCLRQDLNNGIADPNAQIPYAHQASVGVQRQIGSVMSVEADYSFIGGRHEYAAHNFNMKYDEVTGANLPFTVVANRPFPQYARLGMERMDLRTNYHALVAALTKRYSGRWQASATYTLGGYWDETFQPMSGFGQVVPFAVAADLGGEYTLATADQRHRAVMNGIWEVGRGFQLSGLYFFGSGQRFPTSYGGDRRNSSGQAGGRLRPDGTIVPRNNFVGDPVHRIDLRLQQRVPLGGRARIDGILEVFNLINHANYGLYTTVESNRLYGQPSQIANVAYAPRMLQLGFRLTF